MTALVLVRYWDNIPVRYQEILFYYVGTDVVY